MPDWAVGTRFTCGDHQYEIVGHGHDEWGKYCVIPESDGVSRRSFQRLTAALEDGKIMLVDDKETPE